LNSVLYKSEIEAYLADQITLKEPQNLYQPITYILELGGKRLRPSLTLMSAEMFGADHSIALPAAAAVETFHNFTLVHDDIMDHAPLRRGEQTVHTKWNINTGILSGDALLILAYKFLESYDGETFKRLHTLLNKTAIEIIEGQQLDVDFETQSDVTVDAYLKMIELKTAALVGAALQMGAIVANATEQQASKIYDFGRLLGIAFQLQDDYLDVFGDPDQFGKQLGGDILEKKKTFLYLSCLNSCKGEEKEAFDFLYNDSEENPFKVNDVLRYFDIKKNVLYLQY